MSEKDNNRHARQVTVTRIKKDNPPQENKPRKVIAVKRREEAAPVPVQPEKKPAAVPTVPAANKFPIGFRVDDTPEEHCPEPEIPNEEPLAEPEHPLTEETEGLADQPEENSSQSEPAEEQPSEETSAENEEKPEEAEEKQDEPEAAGEETAQSGDAPEEPEAQEIPAEATEPPAENSPVVPDAEIIPEPTEEAAERSAAEADSEQAEDDLPIWEVMLDKTFDFAREKWDIAKTWISRKLPGMIPQKIIPQKWEDIGPVRKAVMILSVVIILISILPMFVGIMCPGILPPVCMALFFFFCALYWPLIEQCESMKGNIIIGIVAVCVLAGVSYMAFVSGKMISASTNTLRNNTSEVTVIVLGCKIKGDRPSLMLEARLEEAAEFLLEHPQAHCIVTGGQGPDEEYPEAQVMKNYLVEKGVSPMRIIMESTSTSTLENITNAAELAKKYHCHDRFMIATDRFHQYRAMTIANDLGMVTYALNVETAWYLAMPYWFREIAAITRDWIVA